MFLSKRNGTYYVFYKNSQGRRTCISTKSKSKRDAHKFLAGLKDEIKKREEEKFHRIDIQSFSQKFLSYSALRHSYKTGKDYQNTFNQLKKYLGNVLLNEMSELKISEFLRDRRRISVYAAGKDLRYLKCAFNWAIKQNYLLENPCKFIPPFQIPEQQPLFLTQDEFSNLINIIDNSTLKDIVIFAVNTGLRRNEILNLEWEQINLEEKFLILNNHTHTTKSKRVRTIPLNQNAFEIIEKRANTNQELVFICNNVPVAPDYTTKKFKKYVIKAGLNPKLKFHSLRHTFASWLVQKGISIYQVSKLLGHSDLKTTEIYSHLSPENFRTAVDMLN